MITAIANAAGSAGKSTTVVTLAGLLAEQGRTVLVVDGDAQATATEWLGLDRHHLSRQLGDVLLRRCRASEALSPTPTPGITVLPASRQLDADLVSLNAAPGREQRLRLALAEVVEQFDTVLIDCPGLLSTLTVSALVTADAVITVTQPTMKEISGIPELEQVIADVAEAYRPGLTLAAIVPCIVPAANAGALYTAAQDLLREQWPTLVTPTIRRSVRVPEAHAAAHPLTSHAPNDPALGDYRAVLADLIAKGAL